MTLRIAALLCLSSIAVAQPAPPDAAPAPPVVPAVAPAAPVAVVESGGPPQNGFQLQARMSTQLGVSSIISPGFSVGYRMGGIVIGAEVGVTAGKLQNDTTTDSFSLVSLMPMIYYDVWQSADGRARLDLVGGIGVGQGKLTSDSGGTTSESTATYIPLLAGLGGDYYLHKNFALGVEIGAEVPLLASVKDSGMDQHVSGGLESLHGLIRITFVTGR